MAEDDKPKVGSRWRNKEGRRLTVVSVREGYSLGCSVLIRYDGSGRNARTSLYRFIQGSYHTMYFPL